MWDQGGKDKEREIEQALDRKWVGDKELRENKVHSIARHCKCRVKKLTVFFFTLV